MNKTYVVEAACVFKNPYNDISTYTCRRTESLTVYIR